MRFAPTVAHHWHVIQLCVVQADRADGTAPGPDVAAKPPTSPENGEADSFERCHLLVRPGRPWVRRRPGPAASIPLTRSPGYPKTCLTPRALQAGQDVIRDSLTHVCPFLRLGSRSFTGSTPWKLHWSGVPLGIVGPASCQPSDGECGGDDAVGEAQSPPATVELTPRAAAVRLWAASMNEPLRRHCGQVATSTRPWMAWRAPRIRATVTEVGSPGPPKTSSTLAGAARSRPAQARRMAPIAGRGDERRGDVDGRCHWSVPSSCAVRQVVAGSLEARTRR